MEACGFRVFFFQIFRNFSFTVDAEVSLKQSQKPDIEYFTFQGRDNFPDKVRVYVVYITPKCLTSAPRMRTFEMGTTLELFNIEDILRGYEYSPYTNTLESVENEANVCIKPQSPGVSK
jgi:hypothetical protein